MQKHALCNQSLCKTGWFTTKMMLFMKMTIILLTAAFLNVSAKGVSQKISFNGKNVTLEKIFSEVEKQTGFVFFYNGPLLKETRPITVAAENMPLREFLDRILKDQPIDYSLRNKNIIISKKITYTFPKVNVTMTMPEFLPISGMVLDEDGKPIPGVNVMIRGSQKGTITDAKGVFSLNASPGEILVFSSIGYERKDVPVESAPRYFLVKLKRSTSDLDQVQITAYGTTTKRLATGNITTITAKDIAKSPARNVIEILQGQVPGLFVQQQSGLPGTPFNMLIRGKQSFGESQPLIIVDGVAYPSERLPIYQPSGVTDQTYNNILKGGNPLDYIDPSTISSVEVLKDADATAIYGSRGAYGVILITTKKGKAGPSRLNLSANTGVTVRGTSPKLLNTEQYLELRREAKKNDNATITASDNDLNGNWPADRYTDWVKDFTGNHAVVQRVNGSYSGGSGNTNFLIGGSYRKQNSIQVGKGSVRDAGLNFNVNNRSANNKLTINLSGLYSITTDDMVPYDFSQGSIATMAPNAPKLFLPDGSLNWETGSNPAQTKNIIYKNTTNNLNANLNFRYEPVRGLVFNATGVFNNISSKELRAQPSTFYNPATAYQTTSTLNLYNVRNFTFEPNVNYSGKLGREGKFSVTTGGTLQDRLTYYTYTTGNNFISDAMLSNPSFADALTATGQPNVTTTYNQSPNKYIGYFGIINYNWADKYIVNLNGRYDGSTKFGPGKQFGSFGSAGASWIFSKENWFSDLLPLISFAKLRGSYGTVGGDGIDNYLYLTTYARNSTQYQGNLSLFSNGLANDQLHWEHNRKAEIAMALSFLNDKVSIEGAYYHNKTSDQLVNQLLPTTTGFAARLINSPAVITNWGYEFDVMSKNMTRRDFSWSSRLAVTLPKNKLNAYPGIEQTTTNYNYVLDKPVQGIRVFNYAGVDPATGFYTFYNRKGEKGTYRLLTDPTTLDANLDRTEFIDLTPKYYGSLSNTFTYKGISLDVLFTFTNRIGKNFLGSQTFSPGQVQNVSVVALDRWQKPGDITDVPRASQNLGALFMQSNFTNSTGAYTRATYARLQNVNIAYNFPATLLKRAHITALSIFAQGANLLTISKFGDYDPENLGAGMAPLRTFSAGLNITL